MTILIILYYFNILGLIGAMFVLIHHISGMEMKYNIIKVFFRTLMFDFRYICWFVCWLRSNPFAYVGFTAVITLLALVVQLTGLLANSQIFERNIWMLSASPIVWFCMNWILFYKTSVK